MRQTFRRVRLSPDNRMRLDAINRIVRDYQHQGLILTLRQLYYQLVSKDVIANQEKEYKKLSILLKEGRMGGVVDWSAIEDRLREVSKPAAWKNPKQILDAVGRQYRMDRQKGQTYYIEVWVEKDALSGVLERVTEPFGIPIMVNRGYSSVSAMHDAFGRFEYQAGKHKDRPMRILYLGDFDPSGLDMIRDVEDRILEFFYGQWADPDWKKGDDYYVSFEDWKCAYRDGENDRPDFQVIPIALTKAQIQLYKPPPNPAKMTDTRARDFVRAHGNKSWEVDALRPEVLNRILTDAIEKLLDRDKYDEVLAKEEKGREQLKTLAEDLPDDEEEDNEDDDE